MKKFVCWNLTADGDQVNRTLITAKNLRSALAVYGGFLVANGFSYRDLVGCKCDGLEYRLYHVSVDFDLTK